jgi:mRNA interferase MazF
MVIGQYDVFIVALDPTLGAEMQKTRPCVIVSPDEMNARLRTVQIAPMTTTVQPYPWRVALAFQGKKGVVALDQIRTVDKRRLVKRTGHVRAAVIAQIKRVLQEMLVD